MRRIQFNRFTRGIVPLTSPASMPMFYEALDKMPLSIRSWSCSRCGEQHDRDENASKNIRDEASRMLAAGTVATAVRGSVRQCKGRKSSTIAGPVENGSFAL